MAAVSPGAGVTNLLTDRLPNDFTDNSGCDARLWVPGPYSNDGSGTQSQHEFVPFAESWDCCDVTSSYRRALNAHCRALPVATPGRSGVFQAGRMWLVRLHPGSKPGLNVAPGLTFESPTSFAIKMASSWSGSITWTGAGWPRLACTSWPRSPLFTRVAPPARHPRKPALQLR